MATDQAVRSELRMHGLLPHRHVSLQLEIDRANGALQACSTPLEQYKVVLLVHRSTSRSCHYWVAQSSLSIHAGLPLQALAVLREHNQDAFFGLLAQNISELLPIVYTPTVGDACKNWAALLQRPQGLYVSIKDKVTFISSVEANATNFSLQHSLDALCASMQTLCHTPVRINPTVCVQTCCLLLYPLHFG